MTSINYLDSEALSIRINENRPAKCSKGSARTRPSLILGLNNVSRPMEPGTSMRPGKFLFFGVLGCTILAGEEVSTFHCVVEALPFHAFAEKC